jgi:hypothetical protein
MSEPIYHNADGDVISEQEFNNRYDEDIATQREQIAYLNGVLDGFRELLGLKMFDQPYVMPPEFLPRTIDNYQGGKELACIQVTLQNIVDRLERLERTLFGRQHD